MADCSMAREAFWEGNVSQNFLLFFKCIAYRIFSWTFIVCFLIIQAVVMLPVYQIIFSSACVKNDTSFVTSVTRNVSHGCHAQWPWVTLKVIGLLHDLSNAIRRTFVRHFARFNWHGASRIPSVISELLVWLGIGMADPQNGGPSLLSIPTIQVSVLSKLAEWIIELVFGTGASYHLSYTMFKRNVGYLQK